jgi:hypothetical protein
MLFSLTFECSDGGVAFVRGDASTLRFSEPWIDDRGREVVTISAWSSAAVVFAEVAEKIKKERPFGKEKNTRGK